MSDKKNTINQKITELDQLVAYFESEDHEFDIDQDLAKYEQAMQIVSKLKKELQSIELKIKDIKAKYRDD